MCSALPFLFALPAGLSEQDPLLQGRPAQRVPSGGGGLPSVEGNGLHLLSRHSENMTV